TEKAVAVGNRFLLLKMIIILLAVYFILWKSLNSTVLRGLLLMAVLNCHAIQKQAGAMRLFRLTMPLFRLTMPLF
ncbi:MAG: hypothetical protein V7L25_22545, partial [Nostoc sp.]